ncbi:MAG: 2-oxoacid:ferredoxin oxidoreductase subunit beta [Saprospiraceae bacterium]
MSFIKPEFRHVKQPVNDLGYTLDHYEGALSTLCAGCGHDSVSSAIVQACFELNLEPHKVAKLSGIGCSSKTPTYFLRHSHGFNSVHGRMPSVATGASLANRDLTYIGISGDGDTASIGMGQFVHAVRRNLNMAYIVMNNGCYGLTKGQDSATADQGSISKAGQANPFDAIDLVALAIELGAGFAARSFSGDKGQLVPVLKAALSYPGFAFVDVISPCVTFNNNPGSTKSYGYTREHLEQLSVVDYIPEKEAIEVEYEGQANVALHDGSLIHLEKLAPDWNPSRPEDALRKLHEARHAGRVLTGVVYLAAPRADLHQMIRAASKPLNQMSQAELQPDAAALEAINAAMR